MKLNKFAELLISVGISITNELGETKNLVEILNDLSTKWNDFTSEQKEFISNKLMETALSNTADTANNIGESFKSVSESI